MLCLQKRDSTISLFMLPFKWKTQPAAQQADIRYTPIYKPIIVKYRETRTLMMMDRPM